jgi:hypothetical protein
MTAVDCYFIYYKHILELQKLPRRFIKKHYGWIKVEFVKCSSDPKEGKERQTEENREHTEKKQ